MEERLNSLKGTVDELKVECKDRDERTHQAIIQIHNRLDTFANALSSIEDTKANTAKIAKEVSLIEEEVKDLDLIRDRVSAHSKIMWSIGGAIGLAVVGALMKLVLV